MRRTASLVALRKISSAIARPSADIVLSRRWRFSSQPLFSPSNTSADVAAASDGLASTSTLEGARSLSSPLGKIVRHGEGDAVIILDVGGKEFKTLRSTVAENRILAESVVRAESNGEFTRDGKAVFIDRDPTHFGLILQHMRNKADDISSNYFTTNKLQSLTRIKATKTKAFVQLPKDKSKLQEIYLEAVHFDIPELKETACYQSTLVWVHSKLGDSSNPFDAVSKLMRRLRQGALAFAGLTAGVGAGTVRLSEGILDVIPEWLRGALFPLLFLFKKQEESCSADVGSLEELETSSDDNMKA